MFWLVIADQFERKGIISPRAFDAAIRIITSKQDIENLRQMEIPERDLKKREIELQKLLDRLKNHRPARKIPTKPRLPAMVVETGAVYAFPAMQGNMGCGDNITAGFNAWFSRWDEGYGQRFSPDSWGAFVVLATGRAYDWLPWAVCCSLLASLAHKAILEEAVGACLIPGFEGTVSVYKPNALHLKRMQAECIGNVSLDAVKIAPLLPSSAVINQQTAVGRSLCSAAWNVIQPAKDYELKLTDPLKTG